MTYKTHQDKSWLNIHHQTGGGESPNGEKTLSDGVPVASLSLGESCAFLCVTDEVGSDADLCTNITELGGDSEEQLVLLGQRLLFVASQTSRLLGLKLHVGVGNLWQRREEEDDSQQEHESGDSEVGPLHLGQIVRGGVGEEDTTGEQRCDDGTDGLERLGELQTKLGQSGGTAGGNEWICARLKSRKTRADDEQRSTETWE